ncbi:MAG: hypothetical protein F7B17_05255 [Desulfurococcales archaeon]|nr:hypothetical protein [Desulfurococcales archaeon]
MIVEERWFEEHYRVVKVEAEGVRLYSIDFYCKPVSCRGAKPLVSLGKASLYEAPLDGPCKAMILATPEGMEAISLRLVVSVSEDPAGGDPGRARELCLEAWRRSGCAGSARC